MQFSNFLSYVSLLGIKQNYFSSKSVEALLDLHRYVLSHLVLSQQMGLLKSH